jgi:hypothetical protein
MGNDEKLRDWELPFYRCVVNYIFPKKYFWNNEQWDVFYAGVELGRQNKIKNIN